MLASSNRGPNGKEHGIADKIFYGTIALLVFVLGGLGSMIISQRVLDIERSVERRMGNTATYLQNVLPASVQRLGAKRIRQYIEAAASDELQAVEIFDVDGERIYVYERADKNATYDKTIEKELVSGDERVGRLVAYFSKKAFMESIRMKELFRLIVLVSGAGLVLGFGLYFLVKHMIVKPIERALAFSRNLALGNYDKRILITSTDEMGLLHESLNDMADALQESMEGLKASFYNAEAARQQALDASRLKSEFLATMSHEIRTPINAIQGLADILLDDEQVEDRRESLKIILRSADILLDNINDTLDMSKLEADKLRLNETIFPLMDLIQEVAPIVRLRLQGKKVSFETEVAQELIDTPVHGDRVRLRQVLLNLLINSTKFTSNGEIRLKVSRLGAPDFVEFVVSDTGIGIPPEYHKTVFDPFTQVDGSSVRNYGGTGLGLAIVKRLVEIMGGRIWLDSEVGKGTTFYFTAQLK